MKLRYPTEKDLMAALRAKGSVRTVTAASTKGRSASGPKRRTERQVFPICMPTFR